MPRRRGAKHKREPRHRDNAPNNGAVAPEREPREQWRFMKNEKFEAYYKMQKIVPEAEFEAFMSALRRELPATFRITGVRRESAELKRVIHSKYFTQLTHERNEEGELLEPPQPLPWYPHKMAYQLNFSRRLIRKNETLKKLHKFLVSETENGDISRQEAVSMLPPLVLDVQPHHKVLDMCAAPGSKTAQLIEMLHVGEAEGQRPEGFVVANDADNKRCYLLMHQARRMHSPNFLIMNHDASIFPSLRTTPMGAQLHVPVEYDRVLCDVPCSGDGTMRKNFDIWKKWGVNAGHGLHGLQLRILRRGLELLAVGGRLAYSTCSLNPIEDEAVVAALIDRCQGAVQLVEVGDLLPGLRYSRGLSSWRVQDKAGVWYDKWEDVPDRLRGGSIRPTSFPPPDCDQLSLDKCLRVLPHQQDTGGFFVAVLEKTRHLSWTRKAKQEAEREQAEEIVVQSEASSPENEDLAVVSEQDVKPEEEQKPESPTEPERKRLRAGRKFRSTYDPTLDSGTAVTDFKSKGYKEDPFLFMSEDDPVWKHVSKFYQFTPGARCEQFMYRCASGRRRNLYYTSSQIRNLALCNNERVKFINMGVLVMKRNESSSADCEFRLSQAGVHSLAPYVTGRRTRVLFSDLVHLMQHEAVYSDKLSPLVLEQMESGELGSCLLLYEPDPSSPDSLQCPLVLTGWRGKSSLKALINKFEKCHVMRLCGLDPEQEAAASEDPAADKQEAVAGGELGESHREVAEENSACGDVS